MAGNKNKVTGESNKTAKTKQNKKSPKILKKA